GVFAGNAGGSSAPAYTAVVDYFFNTASPIVPEDGNAPQDTTPPVVSNIAAQPGSGRLTISWLTDEPARGVVEYGLTDQYELGSVAQPTLGNSHSVTLSGLQPGQAYHYRIKATDAAGNVRVSGDFTATPGERAVRSDDFTGPTLNTSLWQFVNPVGDATVALDGTRALIAVPGGRDHDVWAGANNAPRLMQAAANEDFTLEAKFESRPAGRHALQGMIVEAAPGRYLRFDFLSDGSGLRLFAASFANNQPTVRGDQQAALGWAQAAAMYLRVRRTGNQWSLSYSYNGTAWMQAASFTESLAVTKVGVFAGNAGGASAPAFTAAVDYFFDADAPITPQDNAAPVPRGDLYPAGPGKTITVNAAAGVLANDTDIDGDTLTATLLTGPAKGTLALNPDGSFTYTPGGSYDGQDSFVYQLSDGHGHTGTATVILKDAVMFGTHVADMSMGLTHFVVPADFDGDGDLDLVSTSEATHTVAWFENDGNLNFTKRVIDANLNSAYPVSVADLDQDGDADVLVGGYRADLYVWYENNGAGGFTRRSIGAKDGPHSIIAADVDDDGDLDLVTATQDANTIAWYENNGSQQFTERVIDAAAMLAKSALPVDMDADGDVDIVTTSFGDDTVAWYENDGDGNYTKRPVATNADGAYYAVASDIDSDGDLDLVSASQLDSTIAWYRNDGAAGFVKQAIDTNAKGARAVFVADLDADGRPDVLAASVDDNTIAWHRNNGNGTFTKNVVATVGGAYGVFAFDFDGDGRLDVLSAGRNDGSINVHRQLYFATPPADSRQSIASAEVASAADELKRPIEELELVAPDPAGPVEL
ncbi:MAG TPA: FG-GAP-like repeat-containing protein, partial [Tepidisphaeraceae bacterium]|nr:FG-GAP-like repeat-containing protein [Tepidisphaeraceae bacterium]